MNVVIISASSGIGRDVAHVFSRKGHRVICGSRDEEELGYLVSDLKTRYGNEAHGALVDLNSPDTIKQFLANVYQTYGTVDCVVVTAGTMPANNMEYHDEEGLLFTTMVNYVGVALILNDLSRHMVEKGGGKIICLSSVAGERGRPSNFIYGASKSALTTYLQGLRGILYKKNVHVTTVLPGYVDTPMSYGKVKGSFTVSPRYVAEKIWKLTENKKNVVYIPSIWWLIMKIVKSIPETIFKRITFV
jgi:short-subunit dehydrogenase